MNKSMNLLFEKARQIAQNNPATINTIVKEILHQDILGALFQSPLQEKLVFQGGTALRLCYENPRYSEDLDFARMCDSSGAPVALDAGSLDEFKRILSRTMEDNYGLAIEIKDPKHDLAQRSNGERVTVHCWEAKIVVGSPVDSSKQLIRIEVADVPAYDSEPTIVSAPHNLGGSMPIIINTSSLREIMCDKLIAVANREYFKARDVWDLQFMRLQGAAANTQWVRQKAMDYNIDTTFECPNFLTKLESRIKALRTDEFVDAYIKEMTRFLDAGAAEKHMGNPKLVRATLSGVALYAEKVLIAMGGKPARVVDTSFDV